MNPSAQIVGIGEVVWDIYENRQCLGGAPANFLYYMSRFGFSSALVSRIGNDALGKKALDRLSRKGIVTKYIQTDSQHETGRVTIQLDHAGKPDFNIESDAAWDHIEINDTIRELAKKTDVVCYGTLGSRSSKSRKTIHDFLTVLPENCLKVFDINLRQNLYSYQTVEKLLGQANILKLSSDELPVLSDLFAVNGDETTRLMYFLEKCELSLIILTRGKDGARLLTPIDDCQTRAVNENNIKDTVGAGDSFTAVVIWGLLTGQPLELINQKANEIASYVCTQEGAMPELPGHMISFESQNS